METEPSEAWIQPVDDLEKALVAVRSGPKVNSRKDLEEVVEKLRIRVSMQTLFQARLDVLIARHRSLTHCEASLSIYSHRIEHL
jgi:hypothetical protein